MAWMMKFLKDYQLHRGFLSHLSLTVHVKCSTPTLFPVWTSAFRFNDSR